MGLDIYVGSLTRYYTGNWETVIQQYAREQGMAYVREGAPDPVDAISGAHEVREAVLAWRQGVSQALGANIAAPLEWPEQSDSPYFSDKPAWDCYSALLIAAAHVEHPDLPLPPLAPEDWTTNPNVVASLAPGFRTRYPQLLADVELWLPDTFGFTFRGPDVAGNKVGIGSAPTLLLQLQDLNQRIWRAEPAQLAAWREAGADKGAPFDVSARFALGIFLTLTTLAVQHRLPMKLDY